MNELLQSLTNAVNTFADREDIDYEAVNKLIDIIPTMQSMDNKDVAKTIIEGFSNDDNGVASEESEQRVESSQKKNRYTSDDSDTSEFAVIGNKK